MRAARARLAAVRATNEQGFLLVEVMISAVLVALIVTATFNGLDVATRLSSEQRHRNQAELLAAASQEQLRSEPATALDELVSSPHTYTREVSGVKYTIRQSAETVAAGGQKTGCNVAEATASNAANFRIVSNVTWNQQEKGKRPPVTQSGVISPPTGSGIEVDVIDGNSAGVAGITARAKFIPNESGSYTTVEGTTSSAGCVVLSGIQATEATVEILQKTGYVTHSGALVPPAKSLTIAPNYTSHYVVPYAEAGAFKAKFEYKGSTSWEGKEVVGDTFVAANPEKMETAPEYEVGSTEFGPFTGLEEQFAALTGRYEATAYTAKGSKYPNGDLFPFASAWNVFAGDCPANNTTAEDEATGAIVTSGLTKQVSIPMSVTKLAIYTGHGTGEKGSLLGESLKNPKGGNEVKITNTGCEKAEAPDNSSALVYTHGQTETLPGSTKGGMLKNPFQPAGKFKLCLVYSKKTYSVEYQNSPATISEPTVYLGQRLTSAINSDLTSSAATIKATEAYKEKGGYENKAAEAAVEKAKYETEKSNYEAEKTVYTNLLAKYNAEKTVYTTAQGKYTSEKSAYTSNKSKYEAEKSEFNSDKSKYETEKAKYETLKKEYEAKKASYEKNKKTKEKEEYEKLQTEYKAAETAYKKYETEYKKDETEYKKYEAAYKANETAYLKYESEYKAAETAYKKYEGEYKAAETAYKKYESEYKKYEAAYLLDKQQAQEYTYYTEYVAAKKLNTEVTVEAEEAKAASETVESKEEC